MSWECVYTMGVRVCACVCDGVYHMRCGRWVWRGGGLQENDTFLFL